jgi:hypothetical protein
MGFPSVGNATRVSNLTLNNQFGSVKLDLIRRSFLLVPTAKDLLAPPPPLVSPPHHLQCYLTRRSAGTPRFQKIANVTTVDQFGSQTMALLRPRYFCTPANKANEDPGALSSTENLLCYKARHAQNFPTIQAQVNNQLLQSDVKLVRRMEFCVPTTIASPSGAFLD